MSAVDKLISILQDVPTTYTDYLKRAIIETTMETSDEKLLTCIYTLLMEDVNQDKQQAVS